MGPELGLFPIKPAPSYWGAHTKAKYIGPLFWRLNTLQTFRQGGVGGTICGVARFVNEPVSDAQ
jgi:hypothetical protein